MFTIKKTLIIIYISILTGQLCLADAFKDAIQSAQTAGLTKVSVVGEGVPFFRKGSMDPVWQEFKPDEIVSIENVNFKDQQGETRDSTLFDKKRTFVAFFFASCAGFCPTLLKNLVKVESAIVKNNPGTQFIAITVDPDNDDPKALNNYFKKMKLSDRWKLLTGQEKEIYDFAHKTLAAEAFKLPRSKGQIAHSEHFYVFDESRRLRGVLRGTRNDVADEAVKLMAAF